MKNPPTDSKRQCIEPTNAGGTCPAPPLVGEDYCFWHSPSKTQERAIARLAGAKASSRVGRNFKSNGVRLDDARGWLDAIQAVMKDVASLPNSTHRVSAFCALSKEAREWLLVEAALASRPIEGKARRV